MSKLAESSNASQNQVKISICHPHLLRSGQNDDKPNHPHLCKTSLLAGLARVLGGLARRSVGGLSFSGVVVG